MSARRTVGILGGMGPAATVDFFDRVVRMTRATRDQDHLHVVIDNNPSIPDRTAALEGRGEDPTPALIRSARLLERAGAHLVVMPCNTAGAFEQAVQDAIGVPLVRWASEVATTVAAAGYRRVGVLATRGTLRSGLYQRALERRDIEAVLPDPADQAVLMDAIYGPAGIKAGGGDPHAVDDVVQRLARRGSEAALIACTDLSALFGGLPRWPIRAVDAAQIVAEHVVALAGASPRLSSLSPYIEEEAV